MSAKKPLVLGVLILAFLAVPPPAEAHLGDGGQLDALERLQGEAYTKPDPGCDPADLRHTEKLLHDGEYVVFLPHSGCGVLYENITFAGDARLTWFRVARNDEDPLQLQVRVLSDGALVGTGIFQGFLSGSEPLLLYSFDDPVVVPAGEHDIRVEYEIIRGPLWHDFRLDYIQWDVDNPCQNQPPQPGVVVANGGGRFKDMGWQDHVYVFSLEDYVESEGDPVRFEWVWDDGVAQYGEVAVRSFPTVGVHTATVTVTDDPVWRCITGTPKTSQFTTSFRALAPDWTISWDEPKPGFSCIGNSQNIRSSTPFDTVAGQCWMQGSASVPSFLTGFDVRSALRFDGQPWTSNIPGSIARGSYISVTQTTEFHSFDACFSIRDDIYERSFCSTEYLFVNLGR